MTIYLKKLKQLIKQKVKQKTHVITLALIIVTSISSCTYVEKSMDLLPFYTYNKTLLTNISVISNMNSNRNHPVEIDFVFIYDDTVSPLLDVLSGPQWFADKTALMLRFRNSIDVAHIEIVPQTVEENISLPDDYNNAVRVLMFANFISESGQFVADVTTFDELLITLSKKGYQLEELDP